MPILHYLEIENFKGFGERQRIDLDHPTVLIGPNNCGKTTAIQAIALWSQGIKTWHKAREKTKASERTAAALNRLSIVAVPVRSTRNFWHNFAVRVKNDNISFRISVGLQFGSRVHPVRLEFRYQGAEVLYCNPDEETRAIDGLIAAAEQVPVELLYPMSGLEMEEAVLQRGRIDVLLGQGQTAQVLRNLCLLVTTGSGGDRDWDRIVNLMERLFSVKLRKPVENLRGSIDLYYDQEGVGQEMDVSLAGRGFQQMLLILSYLFSHKKSVLLVDEPDAHLEILRQRQVYVLLGAIAAESGSQVILVTHSEAILGETLDRNLTLLLDGRAENLAVKRHIQDALKHYGAEHYVRARERGYVLYVEGGTDLDTLQAFAEKLGHPAAGIWDGRVNSYYVQNNFPDQSGTDAELARVEGGYGIKPAEHFYALRRLIPGLKGLAILDNDGRSPTDDFTGDLKIAHWNRYEIENYVITPDVLIRFVTDKHSDLEIFGRYRSEAEETADALVLERVFKSEQKDFSTWKSSPEEVGRLLWEARTERLKMSDFAEEFFRRLAGRLGEPMLLRKADLHQLVPYLSKAEIHSDVRDKLDMLHTLFSEAGPTSSD